MTETKCVQNRFYLPRENGWFLTDLVKLPQFAEFQPVNWNQAGKFKCTHNTGTCKRIDDLVIEIGIVS